MGSQDLSPPQSDNDGMKKFLAASLAILLTATGCARTHFSTTASSVRLVSFTSCAQALEGFHSAAKKIVGPYGLPGNSNLYAAPEDFGANESPADSKESPVSPSEHSGTNNHEKDVEEPDVVKTDGKRIYTLAGNTLRVVDVASRRLIGQSDITDGNGGMPSHLLLAGDRAVVIMTAGIRLMNGIDEPSSAPEIAPAPPETTTIVLLDVSASLREQERLTVQGAYVDARQHGKTIHFVARSGPSIQFETPETENEKQTIRANRAIIERTTIKDWLPAYTYSTENKTSQGLTDCKNVRHPAVFSGASLLSIYSLNLEQGLNPTNNTSIAADGGIVYATNKTLYVAHASFGTDWRQSNAQFGTELYAFDIRGATTHHTASGKLPGHLLNQYAMSERDGYLRVAITEDNDGRAPAASESSIYTLQRQTSRLEVVGHIGGLGKGEQIRAVRFLETYGYVVTFRQTDPLYVIDLQNPRDPQLRGELHVTGYSAYLHPASDNRLIGVGQEATNEGQTTGTQVSLFDVEDPAKPSRLAQFHVKSSTSEVEFDPHAFLYWEKAELLAIPVMSYGSTTPDTPTTDSMPLATSLLVLHVGADSLSEKGSITHPSDSTRHMSSDIRRILVVGKTLWTMSSVGIMANDIETLEQKAWIAY